MTDRFWEVASRMIPASWWYGRAVNPRRAKVFVWVNAKWQSAGEGIA